MRVVFSYFHRRNEYIIRVSVHLMYYIVTYELKISNFCIKQYFLSQNIESIVADRAYSLKYLGYITLEQLQSCVTRNCSMYFLLLVWSSIFLSSKDHHEGKSGQKIPYFSLLRIFKLDILLFLGKYRTIGWTGL